MSSDAEEKDRIEKTYFFLFTMRCEVGHKQKEMWPVYCIASHSLYGFCLLGEKNGFQKSPGKPWMIICHIRVLSVCEYQSARNSSVILKKYGLLSYTA